MKKFLELRIMAYDAQIDHNAKKLQANSLNDVERRMLQLDQTALMLYRIECLSILSHLNDSPELF